MGPLAGSLAVLALVILVHAADLRVARRFQVAITTIELLLILGFITAGILYGRPKPLDFAPSSSAWLHVTRSAVAVSLIYV